MADDRYEAELKEFKTLSSAFFGPAVVLTAIELGVFDALAKAPATARALSSQLHLDERALRSFLSVLAAMKYLDRDGETYRNTSFGEKALVRSSPSFEGDSALMSLWFLRLMGSLANVIRTGKPVETYEEKVKASPEMAGTLVRAMDQISRPFLPELIKQVSMDGVNKLLDVGGASGSYAMTLAAQNPKTRAVVFELPHAAAEAQRIIASRGMSDRVTVQPGDLLRDDFGSGYDLIFFSNVFHLLSPEDSAQVIAKCAKALNPGGRLVVKDMVGNAMGEVPGVSSYAALMLAISRGGALHREDDYARWCTAAGLGTPTRINCWERSALIISRKA